MILFTLKTWLAGANDGWLIAFCWAVGLLCAFGGGFDIAEGLTSTWLDWADLAWDLVTSLFVRHWYLQWRITNSDSRSRLLRIFFFISQDCFTFSLGLLMFSYSFWFLFANPCVLILGKYHWFSWIMFFLVLYYLDWLAFVSKFTSRIFVMSQSFNIFYKWCIIMFKIYLSVVKQNWSFDFNLYKD